MTPECANTRRHGDTEAKAENGLICWGCTKRLEQRLSELPATVEWLRVNVARRTGNSERVDGGDSAPIPLNLTVMALLGHKHDCGADGCHTPACETDCPGHHEAPYDGDSTPSIPWTLYSWIRLIREDDPTLAGPADTTIPAMVRWLDARIPWAVTQPWIGELCREIDELAAAAHAAAPWRHPPLKDRLRPVPCRGCEKLTLVWLYAGKYAVECVEKLGGCGRLYLIDEYQRWARMLGAFHCGADIHHDGRRTVCHLQRGHDGDHEPRMPALTS